MANWIFVQADYYDYHQTHLCDLYKCPHCGGIHHVGHMAEPLCPRCWDCGKEIDPGYPSYEGRPTQ